MLGKSVKSLEREVGDRVDERIMEEVRKWWQRRKELVYGMNLDPQTLPPSNHQEHCHGSHNYSFIKIVSSTVSVLHLYSYYHAHVLVMAQLLGYSIK